MQDVVNALLLCETIYKVVDGGPVDAARALNELASQFGQLASLTGLQFALPHVAQRFLLAQSKDALYVCFMVCSLTLRQIEYAQHASIAALRLLCPMLGNLTRPEMFVSSNEISQCAGHKAACGHICRRQSSAGIPLG